MLQQAIITALKQMGEKNGKFQQLLEKNQVEILRLKIQ